MTKRINVKQCQTHLPQVKLKSLSHSASGIVESCGKIKERLSCVFNKPLNNQALVASQTKQKLNVSIPVQVGHKFGLSEVRPYILGIDPGIKGALALISTTDSLKLIDVFDMPTVEIMVKGKKRDRLDLFTLAFKIDAISPLIKFALIEDVGQIYSKADPMSAFAFGFATGAVHGILTSNLVPVEKIRPDIWKASLGLTSDKATSIAKAKKLIPESAKYLTLKKHDGRAEAILLAYLAAKRMRSNA